VSKTQRPTQRRTHLLELGTSGVALGERVGGGALRHGQRRRTLIGIGLCLCLRLRVVRSVRSRTREFVSLKERYNDKRTNDEAYLSELALDGVGGVGRLVEPRRRVGQLLAQRDDLVRHFLRQHPQLQIGFARSRRRRRRRRCRCRCCGVRRLGGGGGAVGLELCAAHHDAEIDRVAVVHALQRAADAAGFIVAVVVAISVVGGAPRRRRGGRGEWRTARVSRTPRVATRATVRCRRRRRQRDRCTAAGAAADIRRIGRVRRSYSTSHGTGCVRRASVALRFDRRRSIDKRTSVSQPAKNASMRASFARRSSCNRCAHSFEIEVIRNNPSKRQTKQKLPEAPAERHRVPRRARRCALRPLRRCHPPVVVAVCRFRAGSVAPTVATAHERFRVQLKPIDELLDISVPLCRRAVRLHAVRCECALHDSRISASTAFRQSDTPPA
jgi:hypothetical protein